MRKKSLVEIEIIFSQFDILPTLNLRLFDKKYEKKTTYELVLCMCEWD
jgi:hypothetical protein